MEEIQHPLVEIIKKIIREQEDKVLKIRGGRGYGVGHPHPIKSGPQVNQSLGSPGPYEPDDLTIENEPVRISKAFKKE